MDLYYDWSGSISPIVRSNKGFHLTLGSLLVSFPQCFMPRVDSLTTSAMVELPAILRSIINSNSRRLDRSPFPKLAGALNYSGW